MTFDIKQLFVDALCSLSFIGTVISTIKKRRYKYRYFEKTNSTLMDRPFLKKNLSLFFILVQRTKAAASCVKKRKSSSIEEPYRTPPFNRFHAKFRIPVLL